MYLLHRPTPAEVSRYRDSQRGRPVFQRQGDIPDPPPPGFHANRGSTRVGLGSANFEAACDAVRRWEMFPGDWLSVDTHGETVACGVTAAVVARCLGIWTVNCCRVVDVQESDRRFAFTYATTDQHALEGAERFTVDWRGDDTVWFSINAIARPCDWIVRVGLPLVKRLQRRFAVESPQAVERSIKRRVANSGSNSNSADEGQDHDV